MDDEDRAELKDARKLVDETEEMDLGAAGFGGTAAERARRAGGAGEQECVSRLFPLAPHTRAYGWRAHVAR